MEARCRCLLGLARHEPGRAGTRCGIYAVRERALLDRLLAFLPGPGRLSLAIGRVSLWGRVVENVDGWRAEFAYPYDLVLVGGDEETARALRRRYQVDVTLAGSGATASTP
jgi:hypothetical protein